MKGQPPDVLVGPLCSIVRFNRSKHRIGNFCYLIWVPDLIRRAYQHQNATRYRLVKGESDYIAHEKQVVQKVDHPSFEAMEAIGGTGDTMTGLLSVLCGADFGMTDAAVLAARINRWTGYYSNPSPATQVFELIEKIPQALVKVLNEHSLRDSSVRE